MTPPKCYKVPKDKRRFKSLSQEMKILVEGEVKAILHSSRDSMRNHKIDTKVIRWDVVQTSQRRLALCELCSFWVMAISDLQIWMVLLKDDVIAA